MALDGTIRVFHNEPHTRSLGHDVVTARGALLDASCPGDLMKARPVPLMDVVTDPGEGGLVRGEDP